MPDRKKPCYGRCFLLSSLSGRALPSTYISTPSARASPSASTRTISVPRSRGHKFRNRKPPPFGWRLSFFVVGRQGDFDVRDVRLQPPCDLPPRLAKFLFREILRGSRGRGARSVCSAHDCKEQLGAVGRGLVSRRPRPKPWRALVGEPALPKIWSRRVAHGGEMNENG